MIVATAAAVVVSVGAVQGPNYLYGTRGEQVGTVACVRCLYCDSAVIHMGGTRGLSPSPPCSLQLSACRSVQVGTEVFMKGQYIEVGVHTVGSFGTQYVAGQARVRGSFGSDLCRAPTAARVCWVRPEPCRCRSQVAGAPGFQRQQWISVDVELWHRLHRRCWQGWHGLGWFAQGVLLYF